MAIGLPASLGSKESRSILAGYVNNGEITMSANYGRIV
jgi:hypothetical protein